VRAALAVLCALWLGTPTGAALAQRTAATATETRLLYTEGKKAAEAREYDRAEELFRQALERITHSATRANILNDLGETLYELERFEEARDAFVEALDIRPDFVRARANLDIVGWALPPVEPEPRERLSNVATFAGQVVGSYMTGAVMYGWSIFFGRIMGYKDTEGQLNLLGAALVFGSTLRVSQVSEEWNYGHGAQRNAVAGAFIAPLAGALVVMIANGDANRASQVKGARIGAYFSPILAATGYAISTSRMFGGRNAAPPGRGADVGGAPDIPRPGDRPEVVVSVPLAHFAF
jgi:hypothetical protein